MITAILFILLITFGIGFPLALWIAPKHNPTGRLGLSYLLGVGIFTLIEYITNLLGLKLTFGHSVLIFMVLSLPLTLFQRTRYKNFWNEFMKSNKNFHPGTAEKITLGAIVFFIVSSFVNTLYWPVYVWDALTLYDFRAHVFVQTGFIKSALAGLSSSFYYFYPLLTSLAHSTVYLAGGQYPQFLYSMFYLSLALVFYGFLREFISQKLSLIFTLVLLTAPRMFEQSIISYTNLTYMTYFSLAVIYFYIWDKKRTGGYLILSAILTGLATWTRSLEPFWLATFGIIIVVSLYRKRFFDPILFAVFFFPIQQVWKIFQSSLGQGSSTVSEVTTSASFLANMFNIEKWAGVLSYLYGNVILLWGPLFVLFIAVSVISLTTKERRKWFLMVLITWGLLAFFAIATYGFTFYVGWYGGVSDSAARVSMVFYPLFVFCIALVVGSFEDY